MRIGLHVVADSCNAIELTRCAWENIATLTAAEFVNIEVTCSDTKEHRRRIESRTSDIDSLESPNWQAVMDREYHNWSSDRVLVDTANRSIEDCFSTLAGGLSLNPMKIAEGGGGPPATRSESDSECGDKPQPKGEGRSR